MRTYEKTIQFNHSNPKYDFYSKEIDEYPFGIALEIENKSTFKNPEEIIHYWIEKLQLELKNSYRLSWDDKYLELCKEQDIPVFKEVTFDKKMPIVK